MAQASWRRRLRTGSLILIGIASVLASGPVTAAQDVALEHAVKATYLYKFAPFVEWPDFSHETASSALDLCVVGDDPFADTLDRAVKGQYLGERAFTVRRLRTAGGNMRCHIMYIAASGPQPVAEALMAVRGTPVLTVTDAAKDPQTMGIINFVIRDDRVRFEIDDRAAAENGIAISSKLLDLAVSVRSRGT